MALLRVVTGIRLRVREVGCCVSRSFAATRERSPLLSAFAALVALAESAVMPSFVAGMNCAEPSTTKRAVIGRGSVAWLIDGGLRLTGPLDFPGFCMVLLLQHGPSMPLDSTRVSGAWHLEKRSAAQIFGALRG